NRMENVAAGPAVLVINDLKTDALLERNSQLFVMPAAQQVIARSESLAGQSVKSRTTSPQSAKSSMPQAPTAERETDSITSLEDATLRHSPIETAASFEHTEYVGLTKPSVSVELAVGYAIAVFQAAQVATKSLAA